MRTVRCLIALAMLLSLSAHAGQAQPPRVPVMILGVAHLVAHKDVHNSTFVDDPLSPKRQAEIEDVVAHLARFAPTKVLIEAPAGKAVFAQRYRKFIAAKFALPANEIYQFGYRLAARSRDRTIYPVDTDGPSIVDDNSPSGKKINTFLMRNFGKVSNPEFEAYLKHDAELERTSTYLNVLRYLNTDAAIRANAGWYSVMDGLGRDADRAGASYVAQWYTRNCYIFANILDVIAPNDRIVVIMGQGHEYLLREFVRLNPTLEDVDPLTYLR